MLIKLDGNKMIGNHVTSLDLSKRLCELGVKQTSSFYWYKDEVFNNNFVEYEELIYEDIHRSHPNPIKLYSAFLASELLELLPENIDLSKSDSKYWCDPSEGYGEVTDYNYCSDNNACNCLAIMLIHLLETGLIKAEDLSL